MRTQSKIRIFIASILAIVTIFGFSTIYASAASYDTNYKSYSEPSSSDYAYWNGAKVVKASGTTSSEIKWMQASLNYCIKNKGVNASYLTVDGSFGPASQAACKAFQIKFNLEADGSFGPGTIAKMKVVLSAYISPYTVPSSSDFAYWNGSNVVKASGTTTSEIKWMQDTLSWCISRGLQATKLTVDGSFGPASQKATAEFQKSVGLTADGSFGGNTIEAMKKAISDPNWKPKDTASFSKYNLVWPTNTTSITGKYGTNGSLRSGGERYHSGIDIGASVGSPVYATADGVVVMCKSSDDSSSTTGGRGRYIVIYHSSGNFSSLYEHLNTCGVKVGDSVKAGQKIGTSGNSGYESVGVHYAAHLHFGLMTGKMTNTGYDLWYTSGGVNHTFDPDPRYNTCIKYTYK